MQPTGWMLRREGGGNRCPPTMTMEGKDSAVRGEIGSRICGFFGEEFCFLRKTDRFVPGANEFRVTIDVWTSD